ncbi:MAG: aminoglycoside phosphotransferase family protein [Christensenellaceae bacterium]|nr:aminoglycoside phosphotransferase family protein [Christensenellaceae bacterium]
MVRFNSNEVLRKFDIKGKLLECELYGCGHINDTYKVVVLDDGGNKSYIIQRVNTNIFSNIDGLMDNIVGVTEFIKNRISSLGGDISRCMSVIKTIDSESYAKTSDGCFRCYNFINDAISIESAPTLEQLRIAGEGIGRFQRYLDGYPQEKLVETIPDFHNTESRYNKFLDAINADVVSRRESIEEEIEFFLVRKHYASKVLSLIKSGEIPLRVTHNDTKINNILIDLEHGNAVAVIDLDTVMPGSVVYDFGDSIRFGANTGAEDEKDLKKVSFSLESFKYFSLGFLSEVKDILLPVELNNLAFGAILMTYECGMRFLTDYLEGDKYFKTHRIGHNLDRARTQIKMIKDMEANISLMEDIINNA